MDNAPAMDNSSVKGWDYMEDPSTQKKKTTKYVFISYCHADMDIVSRDITILEENGVRVWWDKQIHKGENWIERATRGIKDRNCCMALFFLSQKALESDPVLTELRLIRERCETDTAFSYASINIPGDNVFKMLRKTELQETKFRALLSAFPEEKIFFPRTEHIDDDKHIYSLIRLLDEAGAVDMSKCKISPPEHYACHGYKNGLEIEKYKAEEARVAIPARINGEKVLSIGIEAFQKNPHIKQVVVPEGVERIDDYAFSGCSKLESIILPSSLQSLGYEAFRDCGELKSIVIPRNVEIIGEYCFYRCHKLKDIQLQSANRLKLSFAAFSECQAMESLVLPEATETIETYAFNYCISLKSITIPRGVTRIDTSAFYGCSSLEEVRFRADAEINNTTLFSRCMNLKRISFQFANMDKYAHNSSWDAHRSIIRYELNVPKNVHRKEDNIIWESSTGAVGYIVRLNGKDYQTTECSLPIPTDESCERYEVSVQALPGGVGVIASDFSEKISIERELWEMNEDKTIVTKYNGTDEIVKVPEGIVEIAEKAFFNHDGIKEVKFPDTLRIIGRRAFYHCTRLEKVQFPCSLRKISDETFLGTAIKMLIIPENVDSIGASSFASCNDLITLEIRAPHLKAGGKAFYRCINLKTVSFPKGFYELHPGMFRGCTELSEIDLPEELHTIHEGAISYIMGLRQIHIPKNVATIDAGAFSNSFGFTSISVAKDNPNYYERNGLLLRRNAENTIVQFPADKICTDFVVDRDIAEIGAFAFMDAAHLHTVTFLGEMEEIGASAFERCAGLETVTFEQDVQYIRKNAFRDCFNLRSLYLRGSAVPELDSSSFENASDELKIYIPEKYISKFRRDSEWAKIKERLVEVKNSEQSTAADHAVAPV